MVFFTVNAHTDFFPIIEATSVVDSALARGVPIISSRQMLEWLDGRNNSSFDSFTWDGSTLSFSVTQDFGANGLQILIPLESDAGIIDSITRDGILVSYTTETIKGINYAQVAGTDGIYTATYSIDITPPTVTSTSPADGATNISQGTSVTATFNEPMDVASINSDTFQLYGPGNSLIPTVVTYDAVSLTATLQPLNGVLAFDTVYTATLSGGVSDPRIKDLSGNALATDEIWLFTIESAPCTPDPCTIWKETDVPANPSAADPGPVNLGVKFQSDINGFVSGIRFYKGDTNTGTHVGSLWSSAGALLAQATFTNETASGWQQVDFATPVAINANTVYVASYYAPNGNYAADSGYFASSGVTNGPLTLLQDGVSGGNGVYVYSASPSFPNNSFNAGNYWVDVVLVTSRIADTTAPTVTSTTPDDGATDINVNTAVTATFSEPMDVASINASTVELRDAGNALVATSVSYDAGTNTTTLTPDSALAGLSDYIAIVKSGASGVADLAGNPLSTDFNWTFTTRDIPICPCTIWSESDVPANPAAVDPGPVNLGVKFRSDIDGFISGLRFLQR